MNKRHFADCYFCGGLVEGKMDDLILQKEEVSRKISIPVVELQQDAA